MKKNNRGFSIVIAMGLVIFINILAISIIEYIIPFSKNVKQIENSMVAYYQANSGIENALFYLKDTEAGEENNTSFGGASVDNKYTIIAIGENLPPEGKGNSEYNNNWNQIAMGNAIQLEIGNNSVDFNDAEFSFRIPDLDGDGGLKLDGTDTAIINWQISSQSNTLNPSGSYIVANDICHSCENEVLCSCLKINLGGKEGVDLNGTTYTIEDFYSNECPSSSSCILKLSVVNNLKTDGNLIYIPYLEWQIDFGTGNDVPLRYSRITTVGKAYGYRKDLEIKLPQLTTNEAFDFTVFQ